MVKGTTMIQSINNGGLKTPDMSLMCKSLKIVWVKCLLNEEELQWKIIPLCTILRDLRKGGGGTNISLKLLLF